MPTEKLLASTAVKERRAPLDTAAAAIYTGTRPNYLEKLRCTGGGPLYIKRKGAVRYDPDDLDAWLEAGKRKSTSDVREVA
ncbi:DNA-binding protein [Bradyrhizobium sp. UFLA03-84]|uniref:DNA-binding protein n=1 Tax=Bradyrhizobium sp. UFLA03-84 TaxID=418599 RepID=UPI000BAE28E6|nr:DNA-binding protein [Bradyrhizobium sp. UFLA03-84]PAY06647.1 DNA-binding protein [Bradyrhizobium sp. UFLA03-84]